MQVTDNTIFITGGGSGIGRGLAEALHRLGNQVIIAGRRQAALAETLQVNPGMQSLELDVSDPSSVAAAAATLVAQFPKLNVLINNAGVMHLDDVSGVIDDATAEGQVTINLLGPIRVTSALVEHLKKQPRAAILNVSSVLGFVPLASSAVYSSTKAALHSYSQSLRYQLKDTAVRVQEIAPPWVQTDLLNSRNEARAMPLGEYIEETLRALATDANEVLVERAIALRNNAGPGEAELVTQFNDMMSGRA